MTFVLIYILLGSLCFTFFFYLFKRFKTELYTREIQESKLQYQLKQDLNSFSIHLNDSLKEMPSESFIFNRLFLLENIAVPHFCTNYYHSQEILVRDLHELLYKWSYLKNLSFNLTVNNEILTEAISRGDAKRVKNIIILIAVDYNDLVPIRIDLSKNQNRICLNILNFPHQKLLENKIMNYIASHPHESFNYVWSKEQLSITLQTSKIETSKCLSI